MKSVGSNIKRTIFARLFEDEDLLEAVAITAEKNHIDSGFFFLIGTLKKAVLGFYKEGKYIPINKSGPLEIASCMGNISLKEKEELIVHGHIVVSSLNGEAFGGHVMSGCVVDATAELVLIEAESGTLQREFEMQRNLYLWSIKKRV